jgi:hypothetical protein
MKVLFKQITVAQRQQGHKLYALDVQGQLWSTISGSEGILAIGGWKKEPHPVEADAVQEQTTG